MQHGLACPRKSMGPATKIVNFILISKFSNFRFYNKLSVFVERAIGDCSQTIEAVQMCRTEYRGSLLWMKKTSEELDPEVDGSMEKFREAQTTVKSNKERLDRLKTDTLQKVRVKKIDFEFIFFLTIKITNLE